MWKLKNTKLIETEARMLVTKMDRYRSNGINCQL